MIWIIGQSDRRRNRPCSIITNNCLADKRALTLIINRIKLDNVARDTFTIKGRRGVVGNIIVLQWTVAIRIDCRIVADIVDNLDKLRCNWCLCINMQAEMMFDFIARTICQRGNIFMDFVFTGILLGRQLEFPCPVGLDRRFIGRTGCLIKNRHLLSGCATPDKLRRGIIGCTAIDNCFCVFLVVINSVIDFDFRWCQIKIEP